MNADHENNSKGKTPGAKHDNPNGLLERLETKAEDPLDSKEPWMCYNFSLKTTRKLGVFLSGLCVQLLWKVFVIVSLFFIVCFSITLLGEILIDDQCL